MLSFQRRPEEKPPQLKPLQRLGGRPVLRPSASQAPHPTSTSAEPSPTGNFISPDSHPCLVCTSQVPPRRVSPIGHLRSPHPVLLPSRDLSSLTLGLPTSEKKGLSSWSWCENGGSAWLSCWLQGADSHSLFITSHLASDSTMW